MRDTSAFHPELRKAAKWLPRRLPTRVIVPLDRFGKRVARLRKPRGEVVDVGPIRVYVHRPQRASSQPLPALLWIHGGGLVMGSPNQDAARLRSLADELGIVVAAVAYRLAPQHRFPTAVDDCHAAMLWLAQQPGIDGAKRHRIGADAKAALFARLRLNLRRAAAPRFPAYIRRPPVTVF